MSLILAVFAAALALGSCGVIPHGYTPVVHLYLGPHAKTELVGTDGHLIHSISPGEHLQTSIDLGYEHTFGDEVYDTNPHLIHSQIHETPTVLTQQEIIHHNSNEFAAHHNSNHFVSHLNSGGLITDNSGQILTSHSVPVVHNSDQVFTHIEPVHQQHVSTVLSSGLSQVHQSPVHTEYSQLAHQFVEQPQLVSHVVEQPQFIRQQQVVTHQAHVVEQPQHVQHQLVAQHVVGPQFVAQQQVAHLTHVTEQPPVVSHGTHIVQPQLVSHQTHVVEPQLIAQQQVAHVTHVTEQPQVISHRTHVVQPQLVSHQTHVVEPQIVQPAQKHTIISSSLDQTHPSPLFVPTVHSAPVIHSAPVEVHSAPVAVLSQPTVVAQPTQIISQPVVAHATSIVAESPPVVHTEVLTPVESAPVAIAPAEVSHLTPLVEDKKKYKLPAHHEAALSNGEVSVVASRIIPAKPYRVSPAFVAEGPDATYLAPGTGIRGQYTPDLTDVHGHRNDDGSYKGEFYHGDGPVIKVEKNEI